MGGDAVVIIPSSNDEVFFSHCAAVLSLFNLDALES